MTDRLDEVIAMWEREDEDEAAEQLASDKDALDLAQPQTWADMDQPAMGAANIAQAAATVAPRPRPEVPASQPSAAPAVEDMGADAVPATALPAGRVTSSRVGGLEPRSAPASPDSLDWKGLSERLRNAELRAAQTRAGEQLRANIIPGYKPDLAGASAQVDAVKRPVELAQTRQAMETRDLQNRTQREALGVKAAMDDPNSLQSQKAREAVRAMGIDLPDLDMFSANDIQRFVKTGDFRAMQESKRKAEADAAKARADAAKAQRTESELENSRKAFTNELKNLGIDPTKASQKDIDRAISTRNAMMMHDTMARGINIKAAAEERQERKEEKAGTQGLPATMELVAGANPASEQLKDLGVVDRGADEVHRLANRMREVLARSSKLGRVMPTDDRRVLQQLQGEMTVALKDAAKLGQISAGDQALIDSIRPDATGIDSLLRDYSSFEKQLKGMERYAEDKRNAAMKSIGARRRGGGGESIDAPKPRPAGIPENAVEKGGKWYAPYPDGSGWDEIEVRGG